MSGTVDFVFVWWTPLHESWKRRLAVHYLEHMPDGTVIGLYDGSRGAGTVSESEYLAYHEAIARREHPSVRGHKFSNSAEEWPVSAISHARVRTALVSTYRVHDCKHLSLGVDFPGTWVAHEERVRSPQRFSPPGTVGYYFGLTIDAALDEARHYADEEVDPEKDASKVLLMHRTFFTDLLYLAPALPAVWTYLSLPPMPISEQYLYVMSPQTANPITDAIGSWARNAGFKGILYPSARYGARVTEGLPDEDRFPLLTFVEIGSHLCEHGVAINLTLTGLIDGLAKDPPSRPPEVVFSEPNLVVFDEEMVAGVDRPVFYATYHTHEADVIRQRDERQGLQLQHSIQLGYSDDSIVLFVDDPKYRMRLEAPRRRGERTGDDKQAP